MQIYALDPYSSLIAAPHARKGVNYRCPECGQSVRVRQGKLRQAHFYHLDTTLCRLGNKSSTHLHVQNALQKMLGPSTVLLEHRFEAIGRIADVVDPVQKLVFEVQVSPISADEVRRRNRDYASAGYQVVWILHDKRYNRSRLSPAEAALRFSPHYFTNMTPQGKGFFYDQHAFFRFKRRTDRTQRFPVRLKTPALVNPKQLPRHFPRERLQWPICFEGDLFHRAYAWRRKGRPTTFSVLFFLKRFYRTVHHVMLEKTTY